jgi:amidophosphoribosyltransferase
MSGVIGVHSANTEVTTKAAFKALVALQNRGEAGCGVCTASSDVMLYWLSPHLEDPEHGHSAEGRESSKVFEFLYPRLEKIDATRPNSIVGHALFEKSGNIQPTSITGEGYELAISMDGTIVGKTRLMDEKYVGRELLHHLKLEEGDIREAVRSLMKEFYGRGYYSITMIFRKEGQAPVLVAFRDPTGVRPLCLGQADGTYVVASESVALDESEATFVKDVEPGEMLIFGDDGYQSEVLLRKPRAHCIFEWIYFARIESVIEGSHVYQFRKKQGGKMGKRYGRQIRACDVIGASPDSGRAFGIGVSQATGKASEEIASKNGRRTFQITDPKLRDLAAEVKFLINGPVVRGRWVIVSDDSIVRGTVGGKGMIGKIRENGAKRVDMMVSCAPLTGPCMKDFYPRSTTAAFGRWGEPVEETAKYVAKRLGADRVYYTTVDDMLDSLGTDDGVCTGCFTCRYPISNELLPDYLPEYAASTID